MARKKPPAPKPPTDPTDPANRPECTVYRRLHREGRWLGPGGGEAERDRIMRELRSAGLSREEARARCYPILDRIFPPMPVAPNTAPSGLPGIDALLDPDYSEPDAGKRLRDGWLWCAEEWVRVVKDGPEGAKVDVSKASRLPPNGFALSVLATYAQADPDRRRELLTRALSFAAKTHDPDQMQGQGDGFLGEIE